MAKRINEVAGMELMISLTARATVNQVIPICNFSNCASDFTSDNQCMAAVGTNMIDLLAGMLDEILGAVQQAFKELMNRLQLRSLIVLDGPIVYG